MQTLFNADNHTRSPAHRHVYVISEVAYTVVDFLAAACFVVGSALFFFASTTFAATWLFLIGSIFFGLKPTIKLVREIVYMNLKTETRLSD